MEHATIAVVSNRFVREGDSSEVVEVSKFETEPAKVTRGYGLTLNLGNYESARVDVSVTVPCYVEDIDKADKWAASWVQKRIEAEVSMIKHKDEF